MGISDVCYRFFCCGGRSRDSIYDPVLADSEREAVADLLGFLENRAETDFFSGEPLRALSTLVYSDNIDLQRSASLTFAEITERGTYLTLHHSTCSL
jgi:vacuolar protein 8